MEELFQSHDTDDEYLTRFVVNPMRKCFDLYGSEGSHQTIECDTDKFMEILSFTREIMEDSDYCEMVYVNPL
tara:strand:- start:986 stop:1201 length:216 start_codon:yes stop_codon:yes gene_type:complete